MRQGASRHALADRKDDLYETPACATHALMRFDPLLRERSRIWEPCAGRGSIARELRAGGHDVICQDLVAYQGADMDIATPIDFLMERRAPAGCDLIVTNPPYKLSDVFIDHGISLGCKVVVLHRMMAIEGVDGRIRGSGLRSRLIDQHLARVWLGRERLPPMHREGWSGKKNSNSGAPFAWFVFYPCPHGAGIALCRMSWRQPDNEVSA